MGGDRVTAQATGAALAAEKNVTCETMAGLGREIAPLSDLRALVGLHRLMRAWQPDIVHTHTAKAGLLGRLAARAAGIPTVVHTSHGHVLRGYFSPAKSALFRRLETWLAASADALVAVAKSVRQDLVDLGIARAEKIRVIPLGLDLSQRRHGLQHARIVHPAIDRADAILDAGHEVAERLLVRHVEACRDDARPRRQHGRAAGAKTKPQPPPRPARSAR